MAATSIPAVNFDGQPFEGHLTRIEKQQTSAWMAAVAPNSALANLKAAFETGAHSDLVIRCGGEEFKVHRAIVCPQCPFFEGAVRSGFKVRVFREIRASI